MRVLLTTAAFLFAGAMSQATLDCEMVPFERTPIERVHVNNPFFSEGDPDHLRTWDILDRPAGGLIGTLVIRDERAVGLTARLSVFSVLEKDLYQPRKDPIEANWFKPMGLYDGTSPRRDLVHTHDWRITHVPYELPVILPGATHTIWRGINRLRRCVLEIVDDRNEPAYSCVPAEVYRHQAAWGNRTRTAWVVSEEESAAHRLRAQAGIQTVETIKTLPRDWERASAVRAVWIDEKTEVATDELRRMILSGGWIFGTTEGVAPHIAALSSRSSMTVLGGGIMPLGQSGQSEGKTSALSETLDENPHDFARHVYHGLKDKAPLEDRTRLFDRCRRRFMVFTFVAAGIFGMGSAVLLPFLFLRLKGARRVELWWKTPIVVTAYTLVVLLAGWVLVLPGAPISEVTEYRLGYADWPEVFCTVKASYLKYGMRNMGWTFPSNTVVAVSNVKAPHEAVTEGGDLPGQVVHRKGIRGMKNENTLCFFRRMRQPFHARLQEGKVVISSDRAVRNLHVATTGSDWIDLGNLQGGESVTATQTQAHASYALPRFISENLKLCEQGHVRVKQDAPAKAPCSKCGKPHGKHAHSISVFDGSVLVIGIDETDAPAVSGIVESEDAGGRVAWISQVPLEGYAKEGPLP